MRVFTAERRDWRYLLAIVAAAGCLILLADVTRHYLSYGTESDVAGRFAPEAQRFLNGEPLHSDFHPPFYSITLALSYLIVKDWLRAGLIISWISGIVALVSSFLLFGTVCSRSAGFGALLGLLASGVFLLSWGTATSDMFFLAEVMVSCLLALRAHRSGSIGSWIACGVAVGLCIITRTNGISLVVLAIAPLFAVGSNRLKARSVVALLGGIAIPLAALALYASATGSNVIPRGTYLTLGVTYFAEGRHDIEAGRQVSQRFTSMSSVLLHNTAALAKHYAVDLYQLLAVGITKLIEFPLYYALLPGLIFLIGLYASPVLLILALVPLSQVLLVNLAYFQARLYLFLVPWLGAAVGQAFRRTADAPWPRPLQSAVIPFLVSMWLLAVGQAGAKAGYVLWHAEDELSEAIPLTRGKIQPGAILVASKPNVAFYSGATHKFLPDVAGLPELQASTQAYDSTREVYIFYGTTEREREPQYAAVAGDAPPPWLEVSARSRKPGGWVLLHVR